ncbi:MAG TPA: MarR family winged helix-turn-helix transcriptional regulator [Cyclobacteriaceae bacterium]|jgi:DNA-binding MarR family transcriptional regulator
MQLEKDLKQRSFTSDYQKALINILYTHNYLINKINYFFKDHQITRQQYNVLRILRGQYPNPATINLIKDRMLDKMSDASRIVERLRNKQLITREINSVDKRSASLRISKKGLDLLKKTDDKVREFDEILKTLDSKEIKVLNKLLDKIRE